MKRVVVATVILQGSNHILFHNCYRCKKVQLGLKWKFKQTLSVSSHRFFMSGTAPGFVSQITAMVFWLPIFGESCEFLKNIDWGKLFRKPRKSKCKGGFSWRMDFCSEHSMGHGTNARISYANLKLLLHYKGHVISWKHIFTDSQL